MKVDMSVRTVMIRLAPLATAFLPFEAFAQTIAKASGLFNIFVGLMLVAAILTYGTGFIVWVTRLNTWPTNRTEGVKIMEWSVVTLFMLVVILTVVQFFRDHPRGGTYIVAALVLAIFAWLALKVFAGGGEKKEGAEH